MHYGTAEFAVMWMSRCRVYRRRSGCGNEGSFLEQLGPGRDLLERFLWSANQQRASARQRERAATAGDCWSVSSSVVEARQGCGRKCREAGRVGVTGAACGRDDDSEDVPGLSAQQAEKRLR